jgi:hypothetical protein
MSGYLIAIILGLAFVGFISVIVPGSIVRMALQNCTRRDGSRSRKRTVSELKQLGDYLAALLVVVLIAVGTVGVALVGVNRYIVPVPIVMDVLSAFDLDPAEWKAELEGGGGPAGIGAKYESWGLQNGYSLDHLRTWEEILWKGWFFFAVGAILLMGFLCWFVGKCYVVGTARYSEGVWKRRLIYTKLDVANREKSHSKSFRRH